MEIVIVPAWGRADFLHACLQRLRAADDRRLTYWVCLDRGYDPEVYEVARDFAEDLKLSVRLRYARDHAYRGNSFNVLTALREAAALEAELVHMVEEDVFVGTDFFRTQRRALKLLPEAFAVCGSRNTHVSEELRPAADDAVVYAHRSYQPGATTLPLRSVKAVLPHLTEEYFSQMVAYCQRMFPASAINPTFAEQDGLLHRTMEAAGGFTAYLATPRAYHAGFSGYNRQGEPLTGGTVKERGARLLAMGAEELNSRAHDFKDIVPLDLDAVRGPLARVAQVG